MISGTLFKMVFPQSHLLWMLLMWRDSSNSILKRRISYVVIWVKGSMVEWVLWKLLSLSWDRLSKVNEGVSTQRDSRVDVLRNLFNRFKRLDNENVQQTFDCLTDISNELQALGATDITDHEVVKKLLDRLIPHLALWHWWYKNVLITSHLIPLIFSRG